MRWRLTLAMVVMVFGALILSGLASLAIANNSATTQTRQELVREGNSLAATVTNQAANRADPARALRTLLVSSKQTLRLDGSAVLGVNTDGQLYNVPGGRQPAALPPGLHAKTLNTSALLQLQTISGQKGGLVYAAVPYRAQLAIAGAPRQVLLVVVLTRRPPSALASAGGWFAVSALIILFAAAALAWLLGRRFARPIEDAQAVTGRIAAGDLEARVPEPAGTAPELTALAGSINSMAGNLSSAKDAERQFLQSVSHDLRTPLTSIRGYAEAIEDGAAPDVAGAARVIASQSSRLERLVGDLLALATLDARRFTLHPQRVDLGETVGGVAAGFVPHASKLGISIVTAGSPGHVSVDPDRVGQIAANLIENALRFATHSVRVEVSVRDGWAVLSVEDDGPGIAASELPHVFDRLYVSRPRPDRPMGSGLGLAIVAGLASAMGGTAHAESPLDAGGGTRMVVRLPAPTA